MPWPTYTERFCYAETPNVAKIYQIPEGMRAVVKSVTATNQTGQPGWFQVKVHGISVATAEFRAAEYVIIQNVTCVGYGGETIQCIAGTSGVAVMVCGFLFEDKSGANGPPGRAVELERGEHPELLPMIG